MGDTEYLQMHFLKNVSLQANIRNTFFDQKSPQHPEVGVLQRNRQLYD